MSTPLFHYLLIHWLIAIIPISLGLFVVSRDTKNPLFWAFLRYNFVISWWGATNLLMEYSRNENEALFWDRISLMGIVFIPAAFLHFTWMYRGRTRLYLKATRLCYALSAIFFCFVFTPLMAESATPKYIIPYFTDPGFVYHFFVAYFTLVMTFGNILLFRAWMRCPPSKKKTGILLFLIATALSTIGGGGNFMVPYEIYTPILFPYGGYAFIVYGILITYTILYHKVLDIEVVVKKTLVFAGLSSFVIACFSVPLFILPKLFSHAISDQIQLWLLMASGIAVAALVGPLNRLLIEVTDKYLFQKKVNYRKLLKEATEYLAHLKSLKRQARRIVTFLAYKARIANVSLYAYQSFAPGSLLLQASYPKSKINGHKTIALSHPLANFLDAHRNPLELHSIEVEKSEESNPEKLKEFDEILQLFKEHKAEAIIPCFGSAAVELARKTKLHLRGILFLGHQKSDQPYSEEDLDVFFTLGQESSIAFENARLFDEAITRTAELAKANEELKRTNAELIRLNKELKEVQTALMEAKQRALVAGMGQAIAHEVNNPLNSVIMPIYRIQQSLDELQALHEACESNPSERNRKKFDENLVSIKDGLARVSGGADRIKGIVNTLGDLVKVRTGEKRPVRLKLVVKCAWEEVKFQTYQETMAQPTINYDGIPAALPPVSGIVHDLQGVFANLFVNALHALEKRERDKKITVEACEDPDSPDRVRIEFSDNGCGMKPEVLANCFEHGYTTKGTKGTGIGLYYIKNIIEEVHGGTIEAKSEVGVGTTFIIRLPGYKGEAK